MASIKSLTKKAAGRPVGTTGIPKKTRQYPADNNFNIRCTEGYKEVIKLLIDEGIYKTPADAAHDALQLLATKKLGSKKAFYWINRIQ